MTTTIEVLKQAIEALGRSSDFLFNYHDDIDPNAEREMQAYQSVQNGTYKVITALRAEIERLEKVEPCEHLFVTTFGGDWCILCNEPAPSNEYPSAEIEELRKDAARYRWLRKRDVIDWDNMPSVPEFPYEWVGWDDPKLMLDATIDAAMEKQP